MNNQVFSGIKNILESVPIKTPKFGPILRGWFENESLGYKLYLRITLRYINGKKRTSIDIASIDVSPDKQRKGVFSSILKACEVDATRRNCCVYVESILNPIIMDKLKGLGYNEVEGLPQCLFKDFSNAEAYSPSNQ